MDEKTKDERLMQLAVDIQRNGVILREARCAKISTDDTDDGKKTTYHLKVKPVLGQPEIVLRILDHLGEWKTKRGDEWLIVLKKHATQKGLND